MTCQQDPKQKRLEQRKKNLDIPAVRSTQKVLSSRPTAPAFAFMRLLRYQKSRPGIGRENFPGLVGQLAVLGRPIASDSP